MRREAIALAVLFALALLGAGCAWATPAVASVTPSSGSVLGGELVTINGSGFQGAGGSCASQTDVWFGTDMQYGYAIRPPTYVVLSDNRIQAVVPPNLGGAVDVRVHNICGTSDAHSGDTFTYTYPQDQCTQGSCPVSVSSSAAGELRHVAAGFLNGFRGITSSAPSPAVRSLLSALSPAAWRLGDLALDTGSGGLYGFCPRCRRGTSVSLDLTTDWENYAWNSPPDRPYWQRPYNDLANYRDFIFRDVASRRGTANAPQYYDVWNEPSTQGTIRQWLSVYTTAYFAIKAADPSAKVVGPSISTFLIASPGQPDTPGYQLDLTDFLDSELASGAHFDAISWHEDGSSVPPVPYSNPAPGLPLQPDPGGYRDDFSPAAFGTHVAQARALLAKYPALAGTKILVNEYGPPYAANIPGWLVGDFAQLEASGADQAMLTCATDSACSNLFDGLIGFDGQAQMPYWVMRAYADMSGHRLATTTAGANVYALAARAPGSGQVRVLVGRADDCWGESQCPQFHRNSSSGPITVPVSVSIPPWVSVVRVSVTPLRNSATNSIGNNDVPNPPATLDYPNVSVLGGKATVPLASVQDGDAFIITVSSPQICNRRRIRRHRHRHRHRHHWHGRVHRRRHHSGLAHRPSRGTPVAFTPAAKASC